MTEGTTFDTWDSWGSEGVCERCGSTAEVRTCLDPFVHEIHNKEVIVTWCRKCYMEILYDI